MRRTLVIALVVFLLGGTIYLLKSAAGRPPVGMILEHGLTPGCEPTGRTMMVEGIEFVEIGPGCFRMGSEYLATVGDPGMASEEMPVHWVEFDRAFWIARAEITNAQFERFRPGFERVEFDSGDEYPVMGVSWEDAKAYCVWLSKITGLAVRLPSEAEWECACRGSSSREFCFGDGDEALSKFAWWEENAGWEEIGDPTSREVATKLANRWGLHDMHGNAWEWCEDTYHDCYEGAPTDGAAWTEGGEAEDGTPMRMLRGGDAASPASQCRSAFRWGEIQTARDFLTGFRPAFTLPGEE